MIITNTNTSKNTSQNDTNICAKLVTTRGGRKEAIVLTLHGPAIIGRNPELWHVQSF
ncbi:hypothetical protein BDQ17DRAFT_1341273 [Cyathus striatus]|nr:hypothetical protein BDQ17DRAFT_1341273 [Cyathus striatus]